MSKNCITVYTAARLFSVTPDSMRQNIRRGKLVGHKEGRIWMVNLTSLRKYYEKRKPYIFTNEITVDQTTS
jgi:hypothetical protein